MKLKINALNQVPKEKWTTSDEEFMKIACNSQMNKLFDKI